MIPLRDNVKPDIVPFVTVSLIAVNAAMFFQQLSLTLPEFRAAVATFGLVPLKFTTSLAAGSLDLSAYAPLFSGLFLHGGWMHIIGNMWYLWLFGYSVEYCLGHLNFLLFYLVCGIMASLTQVFFDPASPVPIIGASGAISGILGAYVICFPRAKIKTLIPIIFIFTIVEIPAYLFLGLWFFLQLQSGLVSMTAGSGIAWWAHIGGFLTGVLLNRFLLKRD